MGGKNKVCWNCGHYKAYYVKGFCHFDKLNYGLCRKSEDTVDKHSQCEFWKNNYSARKLRESIAKNKLNVIFEAIIEIKQILFEEKEDKQQQNER